MRRTYFQLIRAVIVFAGMLPCILFAQTRLRTIMPATMPAINKSGKVAIVPKDSAIIDFYLTAIPQGARIDSCFLQLVVAEMPKGTISFEARRKSVNGENTRMYNTVMNKADTVNKLLKIPIRNDFIVPQSVKISVILKSGKTDLFTTAFFMAAADLQKPYIINNANTTPRLLIYYSVAGSSIVSWASARANAQHTSQSANLFTGAPIAGFTIKPASGGGGKIQADLTMYNDLLYMVVEENSKTSLYATDPFTKLRTLVVDNLNAMNKNAMPVIDRYGKMYYCTENAVYKIDLGESIPAAFKVIDIAGDKTITASPTIAPDGSIYLVTSMGVYVYAPWSTVAGSPLLWQYATTDKMESPVTISSNGNIAYFIVRGNTDKIVAVSTADGKLIKEALVKLGPASTTASGTIPVADFSGNLFVPNKLTVSDSILVFDGNLKLKQTIRGSNISSPAVSKSDVYFINNDALMKYTSATDVISSVQKLAKPVNVRSLVADQSSNIYWFGNNNQLFSYVSATNSIIETPAFDNNTSLTEKAMIIAPDGSLYSASTSALYSLRSNFSGDYTITGIDNSNNDQNLDNAIFRGTNIIIPENFELYNRKLFVAPQKVIMNSNTRLNKNAKITIETGGGVSVKPGFSVPKGASLTIKTGY